MSAGTVPSRRFTLLTLDGPKKPYTIILMLNAASGKKTIAIPHQRACEAWGLPDNKVLDASASICHAEMKKFLLAQNFWKAQRTYSIRVYPLSVFCNLFSNHIDIIKRFVYDIEKAIVRKQVQVTDSTEEIFARYASAGDQPVRLAVKRTRDDDDDYEDDGDEDDDMDDDDDDDDANVSPPPAPPVAAAPAPAPEHLVLDINQQIDAMAKAMAEDMKAAVALRFPAWKKQRTDEMEETYRSDYIAEHKEEIRDTWIAENRDDMERKAKAEHEDRLARKLSLLKEHMDATFVDMFASDMRANANGTKE
jgi:hypothetical protein